MSLEESSIPELKDRLCTLEEALIVSGLGSEAGKAIYGLMVDTTDLIEKKLRGLSDWSDVPEELT